VFRLPINQSIEIPQGLLARKETATVNWQRGQISQRRPETGLNWPSLVVPTGSRQLALAR